jgi:hypothetical protein
MKGIPLPLFFKGGKGRLSVETDVIIKGTNQVKEMEKMMEEAGKILKNLKPLSRTPIREPSRRSCISNE